MTVYLSTDTVALRHGDCLEELQALPDASAQAVICDPPYGLADHKPERVIEALTAWANGDRERVPTGRGFMGRCVHPDTDILTDRGWLPAADVTVADEVMALNPDTGAIEYVPVIKTHTYSFEGDLLRVGGRSARQLVTPNHQVWTTDEGLVRADELPRVFGLSNQGTWAGRDAGSVTLNERAYDPVALGRFLGLWLGDGAVVHRKAQPWKQDFVVFTVTKDRKVEAIRDACTALGVYTTETPDAEGRTTFYVYDKPLRDWLSPLGGAKTKTIPVDLLRALSPKALEAMYQGLIETDGTRQGTQGQELYYTTSEQLADDVQTLCLLTGRSAVKTWRDGRLAEIGGRWFESSGCWVLSIIQPGKARFWMERDGRTNRPQPAGVQRVPYVGDVHCVTLARHHVMMTRFEGRPVWTGNSWDAFVPPPAVWDEVMRVLVPGGHLAVFAGTRTMDIMGLSIRLAGFEMRDSLAAWLYGSGFPKSHDVSKAIDKAAGAERTEGAREWRGGQRSSGIMGENHGTQTVTKFDAPATDAAKQWEGWGTALKPAFEPILLARKPLSGTVAANTLAYGAGGIHVDACRVAYEEGGSLATNPSLRSHINGGNGGHIIAHETERRVVTPNLSGRWPTNVLMAHHPEDTDDECHPWCQVQALDEQSGYQKDGVAGGKARGYRTEYVGGETKDAGLESMGYGGGGGASRFFPTFRYQAKAPKRERPEAWGKPPKCSCETPRPLDPETGALPPAWRSGTVCAGCEQQATYRGHPTVKPKALIAWLVDLLVAPGGMVVDCFAGSGPLGEVVAARGDGTRAVLIERDEHSCRLIAARLGVSELPRSAPPLSSDPDAVILCDDDTEDEELVMADPKIEATDDNTAELYSLKDRVAVYRKAKELEKVAKEKAEEARSDIAAFLDEHEAEFGTVDGDLVIRWRQVTSNRLDTKKLKESHPDIVEEFTRPSTAMRMEIVGGGS